jgi:hypothetical protein
LLLLPFSAVEAIWYLYLLDYNKLSLQIRQVTSADSAGDVGTLMGTLHELQENEGFAAA